MSWGLSMSDYVALTEQIDILRVNLNQANERVNFLESQLFDLQDEVEKLRQINGVLRKELTSALGFDNRL